jgi:hypothetical protein
MNEQFAMPFLDLVSSDEPLWSPRLDLTGVDLAVVLPLAAVAAAAVLAFLWNLALKRRDERRELRAVTRLLDLELAQAAAWLDPEGTRRKRWDAPDLYETARPPGRLSFAVWDEHKLLMARHLKYSRWGPLTERLCGDRASAGLCNGRSRRRRDR